MSCQRAVYQWTEVVTTHLPHLSKPQASVLALWSLGMVLVISVLYRGWAIPVAWTVLPAGEKHAWRPEWLRMLRQVRAAVPRRFFVIVLADRGLYARWLYRRIVRLGWHPLLRINVGGTFRPAASGRYQSLRSLVSQPGTQWVGTGTAFVGPRRRLNCTLLARWDEGYADPWLLLTDLAPSAGEACWYGLRAWIEQGFKITKRAGWQWQRTRMTDPQRAARLWLAVAVATLWLLSVGGEADATIPADTLLPLPTPELSPCRQRQATRLRLVSVFRQGWMAIMVALLNQRRLPTGRFVPEPWPGSENRRTKLEVTRELPLAA